ncbi:MAG: hypothetical protein C5B55_00780 [Blastocatellia bacterium]|nr:MAG: hypothetical protein C5B55_00780 [Blastocatellia bacterium]
MKARYRNTTLLVRSFDVSINPFVGRLIGLCGVLLWLLLVTSTTAAQGTNESSTVNISASSSIEIIKLRWKREVRLPRNFDPSVIPTGGTFNDPSTRVSSSTSTSAASDATRTAAARSSADSAGGTFPATPSRLPVFYVYSMKIKNVGSKAIEGIAWDYIFIDPNLNSEIGRHQFLTYSKILTSKTATLRGDLRTPPISVIGTPTSGSSQHSRYIERGVVQCVLYEDESVWKNPSAKPGICEFLKSKSPVKQKRQSQ